MNEQGNIVEVDLEGKRIAFQTGMMARQAHGAASARIGDTVVFAAVTASRTPREGIDFFPLLVEYREKFYAAGRFPGGFFKREARPTEKEILTARATDRPIRALFPEGYRNDVQIVSTLLCADGEREADVLSINAASTALALSEIPFLGPVGAVRIGFIDGRYVLYPTHAESERSIISLLYVGTRDLPLMIEGSGREAPEDILAGAMEFAHPYVQRLIDAQLELRRLAGLPEKVLELPQAEPALLPQLRQRYQTAVREAVLIPAKRSREEALSRLHQKIADELMGEKPDVPAEGISQGFEALLKETVRSLMLDEGRRLDGRGFDELRPISAAVGILPRTHGSSLFTRGETQALATVTLGTVSDAQLMDALSGGPDEKRFMLHYNFPPYSVGEVGRIGPTGRREIGHGALAERSLQPLMPDDYAYTVRVVSEIMESNGSTSMASVCAGSLALMDAGVPLARNVAGISIGLVTAGDRYQLLVDILGDEDHCGDMDFKVAGTRNGITGYQLDLKLRGIPLEILREALEKARQARLHILDIMDGVIDRPRPDISPYAPRIVQIKIKPEKIGELIGPGGKTIRRITETTGVQIDIEDDGTVNIYSSDKAAMDAAVEEIKKITAEAEPGKVYRGKVTAIKDFGAFVEFLPGKEGLVHISELADFRVPRVEDICRVGDQMWVKCISIDPDGKIRLSRRAALADRGESDDKKREAVRDSAPRADRRSGTRRPSRSRSRRR